MCILLNDPVLVPAAHVLVDVVDMNFGSTAIKLGNSGQSVGREHRISSNCCCYSLEISETCFVLTLNKYFVFYILEQISVHSRMLMLLYVVYWCYYVLSTCWWGVWGWFMLFYADVFISSIAVAAAQFHTPAFSNIPPEWVHFFLPWLQYHGYNNSK